MTPHLKKINWNDAEPVKGELTVLTQHLNLHDFENQNLASSFERLEIFPRNTKRDLKENENFSKMKTTVISKPIEASFVCPNFAFKGR